MFADFVALGAGCLCDRFVGYWFLGFWVGGVCCLFVH